MKTIPKRSDLYTNPTQKNSNIEKQMSELLQIKSVLGEKLQVLMKIVGREVQNFVTRNCPMDISDVSTIDLERNLFGTGRGFSEFNKQYSQLSLKIEADIKGVVQVLQKFSFTKSLSLFVTQGILDNFLKINQLFLKRQSHCSTILTQIQSSALTGTSIFTKNPLQSTLCSKCLNQLQKENILSTKQEILLGGRQVLQYYNSQLQEGPSSEEEEAWCKEDDSYIQQFYDRIRRIKRKVRFGVEGENGLMSEDDMRCNLDRLSSNIEQRKFDILACLIEMGQFGQQVIRSSQNLQKLSSKSILPSHNSQKDHLQPQNNTLSNNLPVSSTSNIPPKFNFQQFTFSIGKHFFKQIKDIESELLFIKNRYSSLLSDQQQRQRSQQTQCDLAKDFYEKQNDKQKRKSDRQIKALHDRVKELQEQNNRHKAKIDQYQNAVKTYISGKIEMDFVQVEKITMEKKIARLIEKYELKLNEQEKQLIMFRDFTPSNKDRVKVTDVKTVHHLQPSLTQIPTSEGNNYSIKYRKMHKQNRLTQQPSFTSGTKNKISFYLQPLMKKVYEKSSFTSLSKNDSKTFQPSENATQKVIRQEYPQYDDGNMKIDDYRDQVDNRNNLNLVSEVISINLKNVRKDSFAQFNKGQDAGENYYSYEKQGEYEANGHMRYKRKQKLVKVKSQQDVNKIQRKNNSSHSQQQQQPQKPPRATQSTSTQLIKRYSSQHTTFNQPTNTPTNDQIPSSNPTSKNKTQNKLMKALSLTFLKKHPQLISSQQGEKQLKLPSLSQHQHQGSMNNCKIKEMEKSLQYNKNTSTGLTKKKRKKRHFSQEDIKKRENSFAYDSKQTKVSPDKKFMIDKAMKEKQKKQYIIDFIPKVQEQSRAKAVPNSPNFDIQSTQKQIQKLFNTILNKSTTFHNPKPPTEPKDNPKPKHLTQNPTKKPKSKATNPSLYQLTSHQISLSTLLYSSLAKLKSYNSLLYCNIRQNFKKYYQSQERVIKTNCDDIQMTMSVTEESSLKDKSHFPLSLSGDDIQVNNESSFHQSIKEKNKENVHSLNKTLNQSVLKSSGSPHKQSEQTQLRKIITYLITKHRNTCQPVSISSKPQKKQDKTQINACQHIVGFYKFLNSQLQNSINECV